MKRYYHLAAVRHNREIPIIIKDDSILWLIRRISAIMHSSVGIAVKMEIDLPKGATRDKWCYVGYAKNTSKIKRFSEIEEPERIDFYITRSKKERLAPLTTRKGNFISDPIIEAEFLIGAYDGIPVDFIGQTKFYKCDVKFVLVQSGSII